MDVIENLPDDIRLGDCCDDAQLATALGTVLNLYFEHPLELDTGFLADGSLNDVSDGLCLPWISGDLNSKLLQKTAVTTNASESHEDHCGH